MPLPWMATGRRHEVRGDALAATGSIGLLSLYCWISIAMTRSANTPMVNPTTQAASITKIARPITVPVSWNAGRQCMNLA